MSDVEQARKRWQKEQASYVEFGELISGRVRVALQRRGIWCETSSRAKEIHSLVKKLLKGKHTYENLPDKAGARCMLRYFSDVDVVVGIVREVFECSEPDNKLEGLAEDRIGYISTHVEVRLKENDPSNATFPSQLYSAELQIRTQAQHLWAEMSHDTFYKNEETIAKLPNNVEVRRRINLMSGLIEVADQEFDRLNREIPLDSALSLYKELERHYYRLTVKRPNADLSLQVISLLLPLYHQDIQQIKNQINSFISANEDVLNTVYETADEWSASAFLYQPEALMILERLQTDQLALRRTWNTAFPESELERVANAFGVSFD
jgi:ppGpp synthetase/RelA/SpoT-type nucleotidyltranferase